MLDYEKITVRKLKRIVSREEATPAEIGLFVSHEIWRRYNGCGGRAIVDNPLLRWIERQWIGRPWAADLDYWIALGDLLAWAEGAMRETAALSQATIVIADYAGALTELTLNGAAFTAYHAAAASPVAVPGLTPDEVEGLARRAKRLEIAKLDRIESAGMNDARAAIQNNLGAFLAFQRCIIDTAQLLDFPLLEEVAISRGRFLDERRAALGRRSRRDIPPQWVGAFPTAADLTDITPDADTTTSLERLLGGTLAPEWRQWARAGLSLRELASRANGAADLLLLARREAAAITITEGGKG